MSVNLSLFAGAGAQFLDNSGNVLTGGKIYTYSAGTTTPLATYTNNLGTVPHSNPIILDAAGRIPGGEIWLSNGVLYKFVTKDANDVLIGTYDNINGANDSALLDAFIVDLANTSNVTKGDALVGFRQSNSSGNLAGSVGRTVHQKLQEFVSVKDFGATGDGTTDDAAAIQAAINAVNNNQAIYFPYGTYFIGASGLLINSKTGVTLFGNQAIIKIGAVSSLTTALGAATIKFNSCINSGIYNLEINGNSKASTAVALNACTDCFVDTLTVYSCGINGQITSTGGGVRNKFTNNLVYSAINTSRGMWLGNVNSVDMETDIYVQGNTVRNNPASGIIISAVGGRVVANHSKTNEGAGIVLPGANGYSAKNLTVSNNYCIDNLFHGIQSDVVYTSDADLTDNITVTGNVCSQNNRGSGSGIYAIDTQRWVITGNTCSDNVTTGIQLDNRCYNVTVTGNTCNDTRSGGSRTQATGIRRNAQSNNSYGCVISGNTCNNNTTYGIGIINVSPVTNASISVVGNQCYSNSQWGIFAAEATTGEITKLVVSGNACLQNTTIDIRLSVRDVAIGTNTYSTQQSLEYYDLTSNSATPDVSGRTNWRANNSSATTITAFNSGVDGQQITIRATNGNTTITNNAVIINSGGVNVTVPTNGIISYIQQGSIWREAFRSF